jgi:hypothetical protein
LINGEQKERFLHNTGAALSFSASLVRMKLRFFAVTFGEQIDTNAIHIASSLILGGKPMSRKKTSCVVTITMEREDLERIFNGKIDRMPKIQIEPTESMVKKSKNKGDLS